MCFDFLNKHSMLDNISNKTKLFRLKLSPTLNKPSNFVTDLNCGELRKYFPIY